MNSPNLIADSMGPTAPIQDKSPLGDTYTKQSISPSRLNIVPILRSGLGMVDAVSALLPFPVPVNHLGMFRDTQLNPVEYYNNLSNHQIDGPVDLAIVCDPIIATGVTCMGAIESLRDYGAKKILVLSVLCSEPGVRRVAAAGSDVEIYVGGMDPKTDERGMIRPGIGDVGDRLFLTVGK
jgi:uracil phosphoribosyltransferase